MSQGQRKNRRLYPSRFHPSYYILGLLRKNIESVAARYLKKSDAILVDFGCNEMPYRPVFEPYVSRYVGVDLPENKGAHLHIQSNGEIPLEDCSANVVLSTQVLEHVADPLKYLKECHRILQPNSFLILSTHGYWVYHPCPTDFYRWTSSGISKILKNAGFQIREVKGLMGTLPTALQIIQDNLLSKIPFFKRLFIFIMQSLIMGVDKCLSEESRNRDACVFLVVASKESPVFF